MFKVLKYLKAREWLMTAASVVFIVLQTWLDLKLPDYMIEITKYIETPGHTVSEIWRAGGMMLLCTLGSAVTVVVIGYFSAVVAASFSRRLRSAIFNRVQDFSLEEMSRFSTASLITRSTNDVTQVQMFVMMSLQVVVKAPIMAVWALFKISVRSWEWTATTGVAVVVLIAIILCVTAYTLPRFRKIQLLTDNLNRIARENLTGIRVVRAYNAEKYEEEKFEAANADLTANNLQTMRAMAVFNPGIRLVMNGLTLAIYWVGAYLISAAELPVRVSVFADMVAFSSYAMMIISSFMMLTMFFTQMPRAAVSIRRVNEVLDTEPKILSGTVEASPEGIEGEVEFRNVSFKYPDAEEYVLRDISFKAEKGETVAFIGSTGSGKSTLINLVPRFYDVTEGQVLIDGVDVRDYTLEALHNKIGYVPQRTILFTGTVASNIAFGDTGKDPPTIEEIRRAVEIAQAADFVESMEGQYDAPVSQGGTNLSGGQKQRLAIARAICRKPEILIFDESFSALDYKTDRALRSAIKKETAGVTTLIVAQRIGTIRHADKIVVLDEGRVVGIGTHDELMKTCEVYRQIAYSQLSKEELGA